MAALPQPPSLPSPAPCVPELRLEPARPLRAEGTLSRSFDWLVVGAGLSGATMAERLATREGARVLVVDKRSHIAGNAFDATDASGVRLHHYGAHIFHTKSASVWQYLSRFTEWLPYRHQVLADLGGALVPMPCNFKTVRSLLGTQAAEDILRLLVGEFGAEARIPVLTLLQHQDEAIKALGQLVYDRLFVGYTVKQWGLRPEDLDRSVTARVPVTLSDGDGYFSDPYQAIPRDGYTAMVGRMLEHPRVHVELATAYRALPAKWRALPTVYTGPIDEFFGYRYGPLPYRSLRFTHERLTVDRAQPVAVINHPGATPYTRVIEHAHFASQHLGRTVLTYEFPEPHEHGTNEPYYPVPRAENHRLYAKYAADAQRMDARVLFVGRLAEYRYYDMDQAVAHALALFEHRVGGTAEHDRSTPTRRAAGLAAAGADAP